MGREEIKNWKVAVMLTGIFILALFLRVYFNVSEATDDGFKMTGGSDPYYHKRAVDWTITEHEHLIDDPMLNYPIGIPNPRPPVFDWTMALTGMTISPFFGGDVEEATWWSVEFIPALFGALIVIPVYLIGKETFNKRTGLMAAFLISIMAGHVGHTTFGLADHDSFFLFWVAVTIYYFLRSVNTMKDGVWVNNWASTREIRYGFGKMVKANQVAIGYALFSGMSMTVIALSWKGFPYIMTIIIAYFIFQLMINKVREVDSLNLSFISLTALAMPLAISAPYYALLGFVSWWTPPLFMIIAASLASLVMVPTRKIPWLLVFSGLGTIVVVGYLLLLYVFHDFGDLILSGAQYFVRTKLFDTIAEAQPPTFARIVFSYGIVTYFLAFFIGIPYIAYKAFKSDRKDIMFILTWAVLAAYMSQSAVRFIFNGTPIMAIMAAWVIIEIIDWVDFRKMLKDIRMFSARGEGVSDKFKAVYHGTSPRHVMGGVLVLFLVVFPNFMSALDAGIPYEDKKEWDDEIYDFYASNPLTDNYVYSMVPDDETFDRDSSSTWYLGSFGPSFPNGYWLSYFDWLKTQDNTTEPNDRPAFLSWWDYGFWAIQLGEHPTVADNFQTGYQFAGNFIAAQGEGEAVALLVQRLLDVNLRENGKTFGPAEEAALLKHLNETTVEELRYVYTHSLEFETHNVTSINGVLREMKDILNENLTLDELVDIYHDLQVSTGYSIRYFAIDSRLFPFTATNNIFYAPVTLADLDVQTYLETLYVPGDADGNPSLERLTAEEVEQRAEADPDFRIVDTDLDYLPPFFDTMLYKTFIGWSAKDVNQEQSSTVGIPGVKGTLQQQNVMPGWMMQHFREVYRTFYFNPYPADEVSDHPDAWEPMTYQEALELGGEQGNISSGMNSGVTCLKYYDGAIVTGQVTTEAGVPVEGIRMTMFDESMIPHDVNITDSNGNYELIAPFGRCAIVASKGDMTTDEEYLLQTGSHLLNSTSFNVTDNQAMRLTNWNITQDMDIPSGTIEGQVYWDENNDEEFDDNSDRLIDDPQIVLREIDSNNYYNITPESTGGFGSYAAETGNYRYDGIPPGEYELSLKLGSHLRSVRFFTEENSIYPTDTVDVIETKVQDIAISPATITGTINYANGTRAYRTVTLVDLLDDSEITAQAINGKFLISYLLNGTYRIRIDGDEIYQAATFDIDAVENEVRDSNVTLYPAITVTGTTHYDAEVRGNITVYFNATIPGLSATTQSDENGRFSIKLATSTYDISAAEYVGSKYHADYSRRSFSHPTEIDVDMEDTFILDGIVYYDRNNNNTYDDTAFNREEVAEAFVILRGEDFLLTSETSGSGKYSFQVPMGRYSIEAVDNYTRRTAFEDIILTGAASRNVQLGSAYTISGKVVTSGWTGEYGSNLVPGGSIEFTTGSETYYTSTDQDGAYEIFLPSGNYTATVYSFGYSTLVKSFDAAGNMTIDFIIDPEHILVSGTAMYNGVPMEGVEVAFGTTGSALTDSSGYYSILLPPNQYSVIFTKFKDDHRFFMGTGVTLNIGARAITLEADLVKQIEVSGTILYRDDPKIGDIIFESSDYSVSESFDTDGSYVAYLHPGDYKVSVNMEGNTYIRLLTIDEPMTLSMDSNDFGRIRGYVYNDIDQNEKYSGTDDGVTAKISFQTPAGSYNDTTSSSGYYTLRLYHGTYSIFITANGYEDFLDEYSFQADDQYNYLMTPYPITLKGTVWFDANDNGGKEPSETIGFVPIEIKVKSGDITYHTMSDANGEYDFTLVPGSYMVTGQYSSEGKNFSRIINTVSIPEGEESVKQDLELRLKYEITGTVYDYLNNVPIADAVVDFLDHNGNSIEDTKSDENGKYRVVITEGEYTLHSYIELQDRTLAILEKVTISRPKTMDINLFGGVKFNGILYSGENEDGKIGIDIGRIDLLAGNDISLNTYTGDDGEYSFLIPAGSYSLQGDITETDETPDVEYILDREVDVTGRYNYEDYDIDLQKDVLYGFTWEVDSKAKSAYIGYTADQYVGAEFVFSITNTGNLSESVALTYVFDNRTYWENINFEPDTIDIKAGETKDVIFRLRPNDLAPVNRKAVITINASVTDETQISLEKEITVTAKKARVGDAQIEYIKLNPSGDIIEGEEFELSAEVINPVEFSGSINLTAIFEHMTPSGQWEVIEKEVLTVSYRADKTVSQTIIGKKGTQTYRIRLVPKDSDDETDSDNNDASIVISVKEKPEDELSGWKDILNPVNNNARISYLVLVLILVACGSLGYLASSKRSKKSRRYRRRHSR